MPHVFEMVFVRGRILAPCFGVGIRPEGIRPWTSACLVFLRVRYSSLPHKPEANEYEYLFVFEFVRGV